MSKDLILPLKKQWFEMWRTGEKTEDYRHLKPYWQKRICQCYSKVLCYDYFLNTSYCVACKYFKPIQYDRLILKCGYPKKSETDKLLVFENPVLSIGSGKPELGAKGKEFYFKISKKF